MDAKADFTQAQAPPESMQTLILDNYDSFTYNLYQYVGELSGNPLVHRNDKITMDALRALRLSHVIISPGPGNPYTARDIGISESLIAHCLAFKIPLLGICMGHQVLAKYFGASVQKSAEPCHGKPCWVELYPSALFAGIESPIEAMRYHSLSVASGSLGSELRLIARTQAGGMVMGIEHRELLLFGLQFHPESIGTSSGKAILANFLRLKAQKPAI